jgi:uncharacterized Zn-finger protein
MKPFEVIDVHEAEIACDGTAGLPGHPRVFLHIDKKTGRIQCPYCSRLYILKATDERKAS